MASHNDGSAHYKETQSSTAAAEHHGGSTEYSLYISPTQNQGRYFLEACEESSLSNFLTPACTSALQDESENAFTFSLKKIETEQPASTDHSAAAPCSQKQQGSQQRCLLLSDAASLQEMVTNLGIDHGSSIMAIRSHFPYVMTIIRLSSEMILSLETEELAPEDRVEFDQKQAVVLKQWGEDGALKKELSFKDALALLAEGFSTHIAHHNQKEGPSGSGRGEIASICAFLQSSYSFCQDTET